ncbi:MAG: hypothetical protein Q7S40_05215 [Opitutaceae bacterium]|nr:hypothetical protein [Opitutaceae bacterium]
MTQRLFIALLTVIVFVAGYATRAWTSRSQHVPPPPAALANEYATAVSSRADGKYKSAELDRAKLVAEIEKIRPQIEAYRTQVDEIYAEFDREFALLLNPPQREKFNAQQKRWHEYRTRGQKDRKPLSDEDIMRARERPLTEVYWMVTVTPRLERLTKEYTLDANQQTQARALLSLRRNKFSALLDSTPHPSIRLSRLAPLIERVAAPQGAPKAK